MISVYILLKLIFKRRKNKSLGKTIFILGENNSGKTNLFYKVV